VRCGDAGNERGFSRVGKSHQANVGEQLQFQPQPPLDAWFSLLMFGRCLVGRGSETGIAAPAFSPTSNQKAIACVSEIVQLLTGIGVIDYGADRHFQVDRFAFLAGTIAALAVTAALRFVFGIEAEMQQRIDVLAGDHIYVAAAPAIAAAGTAAWNILLAAERQAAVAAVARLNVDFGFVDKHGRTKKTAGPETGGPAAQE